MTYIRKTKDVFIIQRWCESYGWESVSEYSKPDYDSPYRSCKTDLKEYKFSEPDAHYRMINQKVYV